MKEIKSHILGKLETVKLASRRPDYEKYITKLPLMGYRMDEIAENFPAFAGTLTLNRYFTLYELYKRVAGVSGHVAEIGVYKGASTLFFGKLIEIFEPDSLTMVHGFDWFKGTNPDTDSPLQVGGGNCASEAQLRNLIELQNLDSTVKIHKLDAEKDFPAFFEEYPHLRFKLVFLDSGTYKVTSEAIKAFWPRLNPGGVMIFDQYNNEVAPGETRAITELLPYEVIQTIPGSWMPNAFIVKGGSYNAVEQKG